ncbi:MAG: bifunctional folylpolyglutamate synthase/dihydrofolate synthase [Candidatus Eiseniibacteriota bacterium]
MNVFDRLNALQGQSVELGLAPITRLLDRLDHPERDWPAVHVAGTNGKGSVSAMVAAALRRAGYRVGLLTSPHLVHWSERVRVDGVPIREDEAADILAAMERPDGSFDGSFFEVTTAVAFEHFRRRGVETAVLETGLGGRLDATNVCFPRVTAITSIDLDHTKTLGEDRATIAGEKAGIVKPAVPVVVGRMDAEPRAVIEMIAARRGAPFLAVDPGVKVRVLESGWDGSEVSLRLPGSREVGVRVPLAGPHQADNLAVAAYAAATFDPREEVREALLAGFEDTRWPGRLQRVEGTPVRVYDVAHNLGGMRAFGAALDQLGVPDGSVAVFGVLDDKDLGGMAKELARRFRRAVAVTPPHPVRARKAEETAAALTAAGIEAHVKDDPAAACEEAARLAGGGGWVFVTGSLFTVGAAMEHFRDPVDLPVARAAPAA